MIDSGWNLMIERVDADDREWFWWSVEHWAPDTVRFVGPTSIEVVDVAGGTYSVEFDWDSLEPTERYCLRPEYCTRHPWDTYTHGRVTSPGGGIPQADTPGPWACGPSRPPLTF